MQEALGSSLHPASRDTCTCSFPQGSWAGTGPMGLNGMEGHRPSAAARDCDFVNSLQVQQ